MKLAAQTVLRIGLPNVVNINSAEQPTYKILSHDSVFSTRFSRSQLLFAVRMSLAYLVLSRKERRRRKCVESANLTRFEGENQDDSS